VANSRVWLSCQTRIVIFIADFPSAEKNAFYGRNRAFRRNRKARAQPIDREKEAAMKNIVRSVVSFVKNEEGVTAAECALMLALVIVICIVSINQINPSPSADQPVAVQSVALK